MKDMWPAIDDDSNNFEENIALDILKEQANAIKNKTKGKIKGLVSEINYINNFEDFPSVRIAVNAFSNLLESTVPKQKAQKELLEEELSDKTDVNYLYNIKTYKFEIYSDSFRFRILVLLNRTDFPISITVDEGIRQELKMEKQITIENNTQFEELLSRILHSAKMKSVLYRMLSFQEEDIEKKILRILENGKENTLFSIARRIRFTQASTSDILKSMKEKNLITENEEGRFSKL